MPPKQSETNSIVVIILIVLIGSIVLVCGAGGILLPPAIQQMREARRRQQAVANLKQVEIALKNYGEVYQTQSVQETPPIVAISTSAAELIAQQHRDHWLETHPDESCDFAKLAGIEQATTGWQVTFETVVLGDEPEDETRHCLHVHLTQDGQLRQVVREPETHPESSAREPEAELPVR